MEFRDGVTILKRPRKEIISTSKKKLRNPLQPAVFSRYIGLWMSEDDCDFDANYSKRGLSAGSQARAPFGLVNISAALSFAGQR